MFDVAPTELLVLGAVALLVIPPKDLPKAMRVAGYWVSRARGAARQFRAGFDNIIRESELQEMEKTWKAENERIMREHPPTPAMLAIEPPTDVHSWPGLSGDEAPVVMVEPPVIAPAVDDNGVPVVPAPAPESVVAKAPAKVVAKAPAKATARKAPVRKTPAKKPGASS